MESFESGLGSVIEFSVGLAGFSAIVSVFIHQSGELSPVDRFRTISLLVLALMPALLAFICVGLMFELSEVDAAARVTSTVFAASLLSALLQNNKARNALPDDHRRALSGPLVALMYAATAANMALQAISALGFVGAPRTVLYLGLVFVLFQGVVQFVRIIVGRRVRNGA
jgi:cytochrome bd-type quinol oxidase subunit 2